MHTGICPLLQLHYKKYLWYPFMKGETRLSRNTRNVVSENHSVVSDSLWPRGLYSPWNSPGILEQVAFPLEKEMATHSSNLAWRIPGTEEPGRLPSMGSHRVGHNWSDLATAAFPLSMGSSQPRDRTQVSHTAGRFFTSWVTREAQEMQNRGK